MEEGSLSITSSDNLDQHLPRQQSTSSIQHAAIGNRILSWGAAGIPSTYFYISVSNEAAHTNELNLSTDPNQLKP